MTIDGEQTELWTDEKRAELKKRQAAIREAREAWLKACPDPDCYSMPFFTYKEISPKEAQARKKLFETIDLLIEQRNNKD